MCLSYEKCHDPHSIIYFSLIFFLFQVAAELAAKEEAKEKKKKEKGKGKKEKEKKKEKKGKDKAKGKKGKGAEEVRRQLFLVTRDSTKSCGAPLHVSQIL